MCFSYLFDLKSLHTLLIFLIGRLCFPLDGKDCEGPLSVFQGSRQMVSTYSPAGICCVKDGYENLEEGEVKCAGEEDCI